MKILIFFILSCLPVLGADSGIQVVSTAKTNAETGSITTMDVYTLNGQTNLVRRTTTKAGIVKVRVHEFYHAGQRVGSFFVMQDSSGLTTQPDIPYFVNFDFDASKNVKEAAISTKDGMVLDVFACTNGVFSPVK